MNIKGILCILMVLCILTNLGIAEKAMDIGTMETRPHSKKKQQQKQKIAKNILKNIKEEEEKQTYNEKQQDKEEACQTQKKVIVMANKRHSISMLQNLAALMEKLHTFDVNHFNVTDRITESRKTTYLVVLPHDGTTYHHRVELRDGVMHCDQVSLRMGSFSHYHIDAMDASTQLPFVQRQDPIPVNSTEGMAILMDIASRYPTHFLRYLTLTNSYATQYLTTICGLASLANVFNALNVNPIPRVPRLAPYAFWTFDGFFNNTNRVEAMACLQRKGLSYSKISQSGLTLEQDFAIAQCYLDGTGVSHSGDFASNLASEDAFRQDWALSMLHAKDPTFLVINYARHAVHQSGGGHFSPIGLYSPERDLLLVMDTARFKYPPVFIPLSTVFESMQELDPSSHRSRGVLRFSSPSS